MSQKKILVVDDDPSVFRIVEPILKERGFGVESAVDGLDALAKIKKINPDLVILDIIMPEINGYDVCCELRFNEEFGKIPILILTSTQQELEADIGKRVNIDYMQKPVDKAELIIKVQGLLGYGRSEAEEQTAD